MQLVSVRNTSLYPMILGDRIDARILTSFIAFYLSFSLNSGSFTFFNAYLNNINTHYLFLINKKYLTKNNLTRKKYFKIIIFPNLSLCNIKKTKVKFCLKQINIILNIFNNREL